MAKGFDTPDQLTGEVVAAAMAQGYVAAGRYISGGGSWKHLTQAEVDVCKAAGFKLWLIDEGTGDAAQFAGDGKLAGLKALCAAHALGAPAGTPIFVGVDFAADVENVPAITVYMAAYAEGAAPYKEGMYADGVIASAVPTAVGDFMPGASGWPGYEAYVASGKCALVQHPPTKLFGLDVDPVDVLDESVLWDVGSVAQSGTQTPGAASVQTAAPAFVWPDLKAMQAAAGVEADGVYGPVTAAAIARHYANE